MNGNNEFRFAINKKMTVDTFEINHKSTKGLICTVSSTVLQSRQARGPLTPGWPCAPGIVI